MVRDAVTSLPEATVVWLPGYFSPPWADAVADYTADASLYRRFLQAGLTRVQMWPQFAALEQPQTPQTQFAQGAILGALTAAEPQEWHEGMAQAVTDGTYFIAQPFHCAIGTKPETL
jgi:hypothetical protein